MDDNKEKQIADHHSKERAKRLATVALSALVGAFLGSYFVMSQFAINNHKHYKCFKHQMMMNHMMPDGMMPPHGMRPNFDMPHVMRSEGAFNMMPSGIKTPVIYIVMPEEMHIQDGRPTPFQKKNK